jgi:hypothetical protein
MEICKSLIQVLLIFSCYAKNAHGLEIVLLRSFGTVQKKSLYLTNGLSLGFQELSMF